MGVKKGSKHKQESIEKLRLARKNQVNDPNSPESLIKRSKTLKQLRANGKYKKRTNYQISFEGWEKIKYGIRNNRYNNEYAKKLSETKLGTLNPQSKLNTEKVIKIMELYKTGNYNSQTLGELFNVKRQTINDIISGRCWSHVTGISKQEKNRVKHS
jgi:DNA-binding XRE family transcriptional regulator